MSEISAADNILIEIEPNRWQLFSNMETGKALILDAVGGAPLSFEPTFAKARRLPVDGRLPLNAVQRVVLGWSHKDESWHLGLVLEGTLAEQRGSRWCELARWPDPDQNVFIDLATEAGQALGELIDRSFHLIPPRPQPLPVAPPPPPPLPDLPLHMGIWTLTWAQDSIHLAPDARPLVFKRASSWAFSRVTRIIWYSLWVIVYIVLSVATLTRTLALPNSGTMLPTPQMLPILGLGAALVLIGMILYMLYELITRPDHVVIDPQTHRVTALRGQGERWQVAGDQAQSVYVTQVVAKKGNKPVVQHGELNLLLGAEQFQCLLAQENAEDTERPWKANVPLDQEIMVALNGDVINTNLQAAGLYIARALGNVTCWYDQRVK